VTTTITVTTKRQVVLPKSMCERKSIRPGTTLRISEVGDGFYVTPVPEPTETELAAVLKALDQGRRGRRMTYEDEFHVQEEIKKYRTTQQRSKK
jgi:AbrB family looped-hinge helix DNA binding protein